MKDIIIVGAGGCGREVLQWILDTNKVKPIWNIKGFIDDDVTVLMGIYCEYSIIDTIIDYQPLDTDYFVCAIGVPSVKKIVINKLKSKGAKFTSIIHPKAVISDSCSYGEGLIAYPYSIIGVNVKLGKFVNVLLASIDYDSIVNDYTSISAYCAIGNNVRLGESVFLSSHSVIKNGVKIDNNVQVGASSVVLEDVPDDVKVWGNPAKHMIQ